MVGIRNAQPLALPFLQRVGYGKSGTSETSEENPRLLKSWCCGGQGIDHPVSVKLGTDKRAGSQSLDSVCASRDACGPDYPIQVRNYRPLVRRRDYQSVDRMLGSNMTHEAVKIVRRDPADADLGRDPPPRQEFIQQGRCPDPRHRIANHDKVLHIRRIICFKWRKRIKSSLGQARCGPCSNHAVAAASPIAFATGR